jgi:hypothetical protein
LAAKSKNEAAVTPHLALTFYRTVKQIRPITVCFQYSPTFDSWVSGVPFELKQASDYSSGDFYRGADVKTIPFGKAGPCMQFRAQPFEVLNIAIVEYE